MKTAPTIKVDFFKEEIISRYKEGGERKSIIGLGKPGIGKTEVARQAARELDVGFINIRLANYRKHDLIGLLIPNFEKGTANWINSETLPHENIHGSKGILMFDEITSTDNDTRNAVLSLLEKGGRLENYILPKDWYIVLSGNREGENEVYYPLSYAFLNRCSVYNVEVSLESFKKWALTCNIHPLVIAYLSFMPQSLHYIPVEEEGELIVSPRGWEEVSVNMWKYENSIISEETLYFRVASTISVLEADKFFAFCRYRQKSIPVEKILNQNCNTIVDCKEILYIIVQSCINEIKRYFEDVRETQESLIIRLSNFFNWLFLQKVREVEIMAVEDLKNSIGKDKLCLITMTSQFNKNCKSFKDFVKQNHIIFV